MTYTKEEKLEHAKTWIEALESGKYPQTRGRLKNRQGYDFLGVACELSGLSRFEDSGDGDGFKYLGNATFPSSQVLDYYPPFTTAFMRMLAGLNDDGGSFKEIAARLRQEFGLLS
jgi:hypothetical protein